MPVGAYARRSAHTVAPEETARAAAQRMEKEGVGCLVVVEDQRPVGILTDRDLALRLLREKLDSGAVRVRELMHAPVVTVAEDEALDVALRTMRAAAVRRLPLVDAEGRLVGIVTVDDLLRMVTTELGDLAEALRMQLSAAMRAPARAEEAAHA
jgi:CBS domain-containing protein